MSAYPPFKTDPGLPIPAETALFFLSQYLTAAETSPYLLPNARLEASGPTAGSSSSSITIHNLKRVEAGLRGEFLAPKLDLEEGNVEVVKGMDDGVNTGDDAGEGAEEGWMDLQDYQREQSVEGPEQAQEETGVEDGGDVEDEEPEAPKSKKMKRKHEEVAQQVVRAPIDTEARKKEKKQRLKAEKRAKQEQKKKAVENGV